MIFTCKIQVCVCEYLFVYMCVNICFKECSFNRHLVSSMAFITEPQCSLPLSHQTAKSPKEKILLSLRLYAQDPESSLTCCRDLINRGVSE